MALPMLMDYQVNGVGSLGSEFGHDDGTQSILEARQRFRDENPGITLAWDLLRAASVGVSAYHGYKRNDSVGWAIGWAFLGGLFPILTPAVALAQGFGKKKK